MTNPLVKMREMQAAMRELEAGMKALQDDPSLRLELEFEKDLQAVLAKYSKTIHEAVQVVDPSFQVVAKQKRPYTPRPKGENGEPVKRERNSAPIFYIFTNPHTGETVRSANTLKKELQPWISKYGKDEVISWKAPESAA